MGFINVTFDEKFDVQSWSGDPILLDKSIPQGKIPMMPTELELYFLKVRENIL